MDSTCTHFRFGRFFCTRGFQFCFFESNFRPWFWGRNLYQKLLPTCRSTCVKQSCRSCVQLFFWSPLGLATPLGILGPYTEAVSSWQEGDTFLSWCPAILCDLSLTHLSAGMGLKSESHKRNLSNLLCQLVDVWAGSPSRMVKFGGAPLA